MRLIKKSLLSAVFFILSLLTLTALRGPEKTEFTHAAFQYGSYVSSYRADTSVAEKVLSRIKMEFAVPKADGSDGVIILASESGEYTLLGITLEDKNEKRALISSGDYSFVLGEELYSILFENEKLLPQTYTDVSVSLDGLSLSMGADGPFAASIYSILERDPEADYTPSEKCLSGYAEVSCGDVSEIISLHLEDLRGKVAYIANESGAVLLTESEFDSIFSSSAFDLLYKTDRPTVSVTADNKEINGNYLFWEWNNPTSSGNVMTSSAFGTEPSSYADINEETDLSIRFSQEPAEWSLTVYKDGKSVYEGKEYTPTLSGKYVYVYTVRWESDIAYGQAQYACAFNFTAAPKIYFSKATVYSGTFFELQIKNIKKTDSVTVYSDYGRVGTYWNGSSRIGLIAVPCTAEEGKFEVSVEINGKVRSFSFTVKVSSFPVQRFNVDRPDEDKAKEQEAQYLVPLHTEYTSTENHISGAFIEPASGSVTTKYGSIRYVNGATVPYRHNGIDIANRSKPNVKAMNGGKVVLTTTMINYGNVVVIDHGMNILTYYAHLASIAVEEGDIVTKGQVIGKMGSTGYSTGTHLDLQLRINGIPVDPQTLYGYDPTKINLGAK